MKLNEAIILTIILFVLLIGSTVGIILISRKIYQCKMKDKNKKKICYKRKAQ